MIKIQGIITAFLSGKQKRIKLSQNKLLIIALLLTAFLIRFYNPSFPVFTSDEARIAYRGYTISHYGKDEFGKLFPVLFNSLQDYQLPMVSYLAASGEFVFGKSEIGSRIPFVLIGVMLIFLVYQIAKHFSQNFLFQFTSALLVSFSPTLIFLSKVPNETIVLTFLLTLLFYLLISGKNIIVIVFTMIASVLTSKQVWFILLPFVFSTIFFYQKSMDKKKKFILFGITAAIIFLAFTLFLVVPQAKRSLLENNISIFSDVSIKNGIDRLRGQGLESGWPQLIDRTLFNKGLFLTAGFLHWLSNLSPAVYFGQFDSNGQLSYSYLGTWTKILLVPFSLGVVYLVKRSDRKKKLLLFYFLILTFPAIFIYPNSNLGLVVLTLPFMALFISLGFERFGKKVTLFIWFLMLTELIINIFSLSPDYKNTVSLRPGWVKELVYDVYQNSKIRKTAVSDDIASDVVPYIEWYTQIDPIIGFQDVPSPYKFRQYQLGDIKIIGSHESLTSCNKSEKMEVFVSRRDLDKAEHLNVKIIKTYQDDNKEKRAYLIDSACI